MPHVWPMIKKKGTEEGGGASRVTCPAPQFADKASEALKGRGTEHGTPGTKVTLALCSLPALLSLGPQLHHQGHIILKSGNPGLQMAPLRHVPQNFLLPHRLG